MGASVSKNKVSVKELNETNLAVTSETFNRITNTCTSSQNQSNVLNIIGSDVTKLSTDQKNLAKNMCLLKAAIQVNKEQNTDAKIASLLKTQLEANAVAGIGVAVTDNDTNIEKTNRININMTDRQVNDIVMGCLNSQKQENVINIVGSRVTDSSLSQANEAIIECVSEAGAVTKTEQKGSGDTSSKTDSASAATSKGLDPAALFASLGAAWLAIPILCVLLSVSVSASSMMGGGMGGGPGGDAGGDAGGGFNVQNIANIASQLKRFKR
ncbi:hypothetical protein EBU95_15735 [bacterium]|nr:hypothetical protein [bacterium]